MCGISGHVSFGAPASSEFVGRLTAAIQHRGPDSSGQWRAPAGECALGHARLSIIDLSPAGHQPMVDAETGNAIVFNGEIYNFLELRNELEKAGDTFSSHSDTEVLLLMYRRYGRTCLPRLRGMFAFAIWDEKQKELFCARDRVGKKPFNYAVSENGLFFCSELRPLARLDGIAGGLDEAALDLYLQLQYIPAPWSIYKHIRKLPPAHCAVFNRQGITLKRYWEPDYTEKIRISEPEALEILEEKLAEAVKLRMIADVPLGALLSGGVDSSVIVALMARISSRAIRTFSIGFDEAAFDELPYAKQAAEISKTDHLPLTIMGDVAAMISRVARHYGEPYADSSAVPSFLVCEMAREHVTVVMNGDGGDELLGGYHRYGLSRSQLAIASGLPLRLSPSKLAALSPRLGDMQSVPERIFRRLVLDYIAPELRSVVMYAEFWSDDARRHLHPSAGDSVLPAWRTAWLEGAHAHASNPIDRMLWIDNSTYLPGDLLVKMDIASMHCGLEARSPLLDHEVIEFCATLPAHLKSNAGTGKYLLKKLAEKYFPHEFVHRRKMGFGIPRIKWLTGPLHDMLEATLRNPDLMQPLHQPTIESCLTSFLGGQHEHAGRLWSLLMFGLWRADLQQVT